MYQSHLLNTGVSKQVERSVYHYCLAPVSLILLINALCHQGNEMAQELTEQDIFNLQIILLLSERPVHFEKEGLESSDASKNIELSLARVERDLSPSDILFRSPRQEIINTPQENPYFIFLKTLQINSHIRNYFNHRINNEPFDGSNEKINFLNNLLDAAQMLSSNHVLFSISKCALFSDMKPDQISVFQTIADNWSNLIVSKYLSIEKNPRGIYHDMGEDISIEGKTQLNPIKVYKNIREAIFKIEALQLFYLANDKMDFSKKIKPDPLVNHLNQIEITYVLKFNKTEPFLVFCAMHNLVAALQWGIDQHFDLNQVDRHGQTALLLAVICGQIEAAGLLIRQPNVLFTLNIIYPSWSGFILGMAAARGLDAIVKLMVDHGADVNEDFYGRTALSYAQENFQEDTQVLLKELGRKLPLASGMIEVEDDEIVPSPFSFFSRRSKSYPQSPDYVPLKGYSSV